MRAASLICAAVAAVMSVWFALGARQAISTQRASAIVSRGRTATAAQEREVSSLVRSARLLNPDQEPNVLLGRIEIERGHYARAQRVLLSVTRSEPQNIEGWIWLAQSSPRDPRTFYYALPYLRELEPHVPSS